MARKRASMREGPLAELFRATEAAQEQQQLEQRQQQAGRAGKRSAAPAAKPDPDQPTAQRSLLARCRYGTWVRCVSDRHGAPRR